MSHSSHDPKNHHGGHGHQEPSNKGPWYTQVHRDWRFWTAVILMILAMVVYIVTQDESLMPGGRVAPPTPAAP